MTVYVKKCHWHKRHSPLDYVTERHHVKPQSAGGPSTPSNLTDLCADSHNGVHALLTKYVRKGGRPTWLVRIRYGKAVRDLADEGYRRISGEEWGSLPYTLDHFGLTSPGTTGAA